MSLRRLAVIVEKSISFGRVSGIGEEAMMGSLRLASVWAAALVAIAILAASPAEAKELTMTVPCNSASECGEEGMYAGGTAFTAKSTNFTAVAKVLGSPDTVSCTSSTISGKSLESAETTELWSSVTSYTFSGCTEAVFKMSCSVEAAGLPYRSAVKATGSGNGEFALWSASTPPKFRIVCGSFSCSYEASETKELNGVEGSVKAVKGTVVGGSPASVKIKEAKMIEPTSEGTFCPAGAEAKVSGEYSMSEPSPLFFEPEPFGIEVSPEPVVFKKAGETVNVKIKNTSPKVPWRIIGLGALPAGGNFTFKDPNTCLGKTLKPTESCEVPVTSAAAGKKGSFEVAFALKSGSAGKYLVELSS